MNLMEKLTAATVIMRVTLILLNVFANVDLTLLLTMPLALWTIETIRQRGTHYYRDFITAWTATVMLDVVLLLLKYSLDTVIDFAGQSQYQLFVVICVSVGVSFFQRVFQLAMRNIVHSRAKLPTLMTIPWQYIFVALFLMLVCLADSLFFYVGVGVVTALYAADTFADSLSSEKRDDTSSMSLMASNDTVDYIRVSQLKAVL